MLGVESHGENGRIAGDAFAALNAYSSFFRTLRIFSYNAHPRVGLGRQLDSDEARNRAFWRSPGRQGLDRRWWRAGPDGRDSAPRSG